MKNNDDKKVYVSGGAGFTELLTVVFVVLKLCGVINWSWVWVLAPLWISVALVTLILIIFLIIAVILDRKM